MRGLLAAALAESAIIVWRDLSKDHIPPPPSDFVAVAVIYGGLALFPSSASTFTSVMGWGLVLATFMNLWDPRHPVALSLPGNQKAAAPRNSTPAPAP